jgi:hypothetical protein
MFPTVEPTGGGGGIETYGLRHGRPNGHSVAPRVQENVAKRIAHLSRGWKEPHVVAIGENATAATEDTIHGTGETRADRHHAASECGAVLRLDDEVRVISLERVVHEAESLAGATFG